MGQVIKLRFPKRTRKQKVGATDTEGERAHELRERETKRRMDFLNAIYGEQIKQMSEERSN